MSEIRKPICKFSQRIRLNVPPKGNGEDHRLSGRLIRTSVKAPPVVEPDPSDLGQ